LSDGAFLTGAAMRRGPATFGAVLAGAFAFPAAGRFAIARAGGVLGDAVRVVAMVSEVFLRAPFLVAVFFEAAFFGAFLETVARGAARFFADLRPAAAAAGFRAFFLAPPFRAAAEVLLAFFTAFFRLPVAEPFRFAITRSFRTPGTSSYLDSYR
jgi:hypothetical protein